MATTNTDERSSLRLFGGHACAAEPAATYLAPVVPELLDEFPGSPTNLLPFEATTRPLQVEVAKWLGDPTIEDPEYLRIYWNGVCIIEREFTEEVQDHELTLWVPVEHLNHGHHRLHYEVTLYNKITGPSEVLPLVIDVMPPELPEDNALIFPRAVLEEGVTDRYLHENDNQVLAGVPSYLGQEAGDTLSWYWSDKSNGRELVDSRVLQDSDLGQPMILPFPADVIRQFPNGWCYARYEVQDRAGTAVQYALPVGISNVATPAERKLLPPRILQADGATHTSTLVPRNAVAHATLTIPDEVVVEDGETITVFWGEPGAPGSYTTAVPIEPGVHAYRIPPEYVAHGLRKTLPLTYTLLDYKGELLDSQTHRLRITGLSGLPIIHCDDIKGSILQLDTMGDSAAFTLAAWQFMAAGQYLSAWIEGVGNDDPTQTITLPLATEKPISGNMPVLEVGAVSKAQLQRLARSYQFVVRTQVSFDDKETWQTFPLISATLVDRLP